MELARDGGRKWKTHKKKRITKKGEGRKYNKWENNDDFLRKHHRWRKLISRENSCPMADRTEEDSDKAAKEEVMQNKEEE